MNATFVPVLELIARAVRETAQAVTKARRTTKHRFLRDIASLFDIFECVDEQITEINHNLQAFIEEERVGMRVHHIHEAGKHIQQFSRTQDDFFDWVERNTDVRLAMQIFSRETQAALESLRGGHKEAREVILPALGFVRKELQAVPSPDPAKFPSPATTREVMEQLESLSVEISHAREVISDFVCANFTIQDMFA